MIASNQAAAAPSRAQALWIAHNYSSDVGYAWANISGLFPGMTQAAKKHDCNTIMSYAKIESSAAPTSDLYAGVFEFDPYRLTPGSVLSLRRNIKKFGIRYAYLTDQPAYGVLYLVLRLLGVKRIVTHSRVSVPNPYPAAAATGWRRFVKRRLASLAALTPDSIYAVSDFVAHRLRELACFPRERIRVIYNGVDMGKFAPGLYEPASAEPVLFIGCRAAEHKGVDVLLRACAAVRRAHPDVKFRLRFAGDGYYLPTLKALAAELGITDSVDFLGEIKNVAKEICTATAIVVPSNWGDACPSAVLEALAAGKPLISTRAGGIPELVEHGLTGILVPPGEVTALSQALHEVLTDNALRLRLGEQARYQAERRFTKERYHQETIAALMSDLRLQ